MLASSSELAPLTEAECDLLEPIDFDDDRYTEYNTPGKLAWGMGLTTNDTVLAKLPPRGGGSYRGEGQYATAVIRWSSTVGHKEKKLFGLEIIVSTSVSTHEELANLLL